MAQPNDIPAISIADPFPSGLIPISGNSRGLLSGVSSDISFVDPNKTAPYVHQYSIDVQRELVGNLSGSVAYIGSTGRRLTTAGNVNINQVDPKYLPLGSALTQTVPNPFFGNPNAGTFASRATIERNQLLRPFPQFLNVNQAETNLGKSQYHAGVIQIRKRMTWWSGSFSYTYSRLQDNQFGQGNYYTSAPGLLNHYTFIEGSSYFNPDAEYGRSLIDSPHKVAMTPSVQLPFGEGRRFFNESTRRQRHPRQLDDLRGDPDAERLPDRRQPEHQQHQPARRRSAAEHRAGPGVRAWATSPIGCAPIRPMTGT